MSFILGSPSSQHDASPINISSRPLSYPQEVGLKILAYLTDVMNGGHIVINLKKKLDSPSAQNSTSQISVTWAFRFWSPTVLSQWVLHIEYDYPPLMMFHYKYGCNQLKD